MKSTNCKYGAFWIPPSPVNDLIQSWKNRVREIEPTAMYVTHPAHATFFVVTADIGSEKDLIEQFELCCRSIPACPIEFSGWHIFHADAVTGADTITLAIQTSDALFDMQNAIATVLVAFKKESLHYPVIWQGAYQRAYDQWGFPFTGKHWLPHISVASVTGKCKEIITEIVANEIIFTPVMLSQLSLYKIENDTHTHLTTIDLDAH